MIKIILNLLQPDEIQGGGIKWLYWCTWGIYRLEASGYTLPELSCLMHIFYNHNKFVVDAHSLKNKKV